MIECMGIEKKYHKILTKSNWAQELIKEKIDLKKISISVNEVCI